MAYDSELAAALAEISALRGQLQEAERDAARYALIRRGQHWSVVDGIGDLLRAEKLDTAIDEAIRRATEAGTWRSHDNTGMRHPEESDISGGATEAGKT